MRLWLTRGLRDAGWVSVSLVTRQLLGFLGLVLASYSLTTSQLEMYLVAVAAAVLIIPLADGGMCPLVARAAARSAPARLFALTAEACHKRVVVVALLAAAVIPMASLVRLNGVLMGLGLAAAVGQVTTDTVVAELFGRGRFKGGALLRLAPSALVAVGMGGLCAIGGNALAAMAVFAGARIIPGAGVLVRFRPRRERNAELRWRVAYPFALTAFMTVVYVRSDMLFLAAFALPAASIALYGVAYNVLIAMQVAPSTVATVIYPRIAAAQRQHSDQLLSSGVSVSLVAALLICSVLFVDPSLAFLAFGARYSGHAALVQGLMLVLVPIAMSQVAVAGMQGQDREKPLLVVSVIVGAVNIGANALLIPILGLQGAVVATLLAESLCAVGALSVAGVGMWRESAMWPFLLIVVAVGLSFTGTPTALVSLMLCASCGALIWADTFGLRQAVSRIRPRHAARAT